MDFSFIYLDLLNQKVDFINLKYYCWFECKLHFANVAFIIMIFHSVCTLVIQPDRNQNDNLIFNEKKKNILK